VQGVVAVVTLDTKIVKGQSEGCWPGDVVPQAGGVGHGFVAMRFLETRHL
jgi:hypothetical protein